MGASNRDITINQPMVDCDEVPNEAHVLEAKIAAALDYYSRDHDYEYHDYFECTWALTKRKITSLGPFISQFKSQPKNQRAFLMLATGLILLNI